jgi:hypothetical protein
MTHKATPEQWEWVEGWLESGDSYAECLLELRDRLVALETQRETEKACIQEIYDKLDRLKAQHESNWSRIAKLEESPQPEPTTWSAINALADRLAALETAANLQQQDEDAERAMAPAPAIAWARQLPVHDSCHPNGCDICQRDWPCARLVAEQDAQAKRKAAANHPESPDSSPAPAGGLVERVVDAITDSAAAYGTADEPARAAILAVAEWLKEEAESHLGGGGYWSLRMREEVERG